MEQIVGKELARRLKTLSIAIYGKAREVAEKKGIIIADTKMEFGVKGGKLILIDELLTPDSSRFWPADRYEPGRGQPSFDKQPLRDYLDGHRARGGWDGNPPPPSLPSEIVMATSTRYQDAYLRMTGERLPDAA